MGRKILKIGLAAFILCLFVACNDSGVDDDLKINPGEQPILKSQPEETVTPTNEEVPSETSYPVD